MNLSRVAAVALIPFLLLLAQCKKPETHVLDPGNTDTGDTIDPEDVISVGIRPSTVQIDLHTEIDLKAHARTRDGGFYDTVGGTWTTTNGDRATIDENGHLVAKNLGPVLIEYKWEGIAAEPATIEIVGPGTMEVTVVNMQTGEPIANAHVGVSYGHDFLATGDTDSNGFVKLEGDFQGPVTVTAWREEGYRYGSVVEVAPRQINLPLFPAALEWGTGYMSGQAEFEDLGTAEVGLAMAIPSLPQNPISISVKDLLGEDVPREGFGQQWLLPENIQISFVDDHIAETFQGEIDPGRKVIFAAGGVYDVGIMLEMTANMNSYGTGAIFPTLTHHIDDMRVGFSDIYDIEPYSETEGISLTMDTELPLETWLDLAPPPAGYYWPDPILVLSWREYQDAGWVGIGFGTGDHAYAPQGDPPADDSADDDDATWTFIGGQLQERIWMPVREAARDGVFEDMPSRHLAFVWENGVDYGGRATGVVSSPTMRDRIVLPDFLDLIETSAVVVDSWVFEMQTPAGADFTWLMTDPACGTGDADSWHTFGPATNEFRFPTELPRIEVSTNCNPQYGDFGTKFIPEAHSLELVSYQSLVNIHDEPLKDFWHYVNRRTYSFEYGELCNFP